jgi:hypothetical protein
VPVVLTDLALDSIQDPDDKRVHLVRPDSIRPLGNGLYEAVTLCGNRIVGYPSTERRPATCAHCLAASRA